MTTALPEILVVEDDELLNSAYSIFLSQLPCHIRSVANGQAALAALQSNPPDIILLDLLLPDMNGLEVLNWVQQQSITAKTVVVTTEVSTEVAIEAMKLGAVDYLLKPIVEDRLVTTVNNLLERVSLERKIKNYETVLNVEEFAGFIGSSPPMQLLYRIIRNSAPSDANIFITGESGTGKEICAEAIHSLSDRKDAPLITVNCAAIPRDLLESEIFGHKKGAFTGATADRAGAAEQAEGGTLFFDEVGELDLDLQSKLLRFIQTRQYQPVGGNEILASNVRFVCATNRDPWQEVQAGRFREDLYYRLHVVPINLPPLRERDGDILQLAEHFLRRFSAQRGKQLQGFEPDAEQRLLSYPWPGNVRELENVIYNLVIMSEGHGPVTADMLKTLESGKTMKQAVEWVGSSPSSQQSIKPLWEEERAIIERAIRFCDGNISAAARKLEVSDSTIYRKRQRWASQSE